MDFTGKIVVGHDGSDQSAAAVRWAAKLARSTDRELSIVHAWVWPLLTDDLGPVPGVADSGHRNTALRLLRDAAEEAGEAAPGARISTEIVIGNGRSVLEHASETADLVVVGNRGLGGFLGLLLGSVTLGLTAHAGCPVIVARGDDEPRGPVVVGVDHSEVSLEAVDAAARLARALGSTLKVVHVQRGESDPTGRAEKAARATLDTAVRRARAIPSGLEVTGEVVPDKNASRGLLAAAKDAGLLVLGHRGEGKRWFGSTAHAMVHHARCATVIVRHQHIPGDDEERDERASQGDSMQAFREAFPEPGLGGV
jgi:nucleotide-binding universal stress UspA family protein